MANVPDANSPWANQGEIAKGVISRIIQQEIPPQQRREKILAFAKEQVAHQLGIKPEEVTNDVVVYDPGAIQVIVENKGGALNVPKKDFLQDTTWGEIIAANQ